MGERCLDLPALLSKSSCLRGYEAHWSSCVAGRQAGRAIRGSILQPVDQIPGLKEGSRRKKLASGFHFIPDRLNEAHGEGTRVTFSG